MKLIKYLAKEQLSHSAFARRLGVPSSTVHRWVKGSRNPNGRLLMEIERVTGGEVRAEDFYPPELTEASDFTHLVTETAK